MTRPTLTLITPAEAETVTLRLAEDDEAPEVRRLAQLDSARDLKEPVLLAVVNGDPVAALSLHDGRSVADPFVRTSEAVDLLRLRAKRLTETGALSPSGTWPRAA